MRYARPSKLQDWTLWAGNLVRRLDPDIEGILGKLSGITSGSGSPEGVVAAPVGSLYMRTDGGVDTSLYTKATGSGNTGWRAVTTAAP